MKRLKRLLTGRPKLTREKERILRALHNACENPISRNEQSAREYFEKTEEFGRQGFKTFPYDIFAKAYYKIYC